MNNKEKQKMPKTLLFIVIFAALILSGVAVFGLLTDNGIISTTNEFETNTSVNGVNISGMTKSQATEIISNEMLRNKDNVKINLKYKDNVWELMGSDFTAQNNLSQIVNEIYAKNKNGNSSAKMARAKKLKNQGINYKISYRHILENFDEKINAVIAEIETCSVGECVNFDPSKKGEEMFSLKENAKQVKVNKTELYNLIDKQFESSESINIEVPVEEVDFLSDTEDIFNNIKLRSTFSTNYENSADGRKNNVKRALEGFNGMVVNSGQQISFNAITGTTTPEKGYLKAKIILNGIYVEDYGGGVCQASTTLYNALLLAGIEILEVHPHSLPVSYVPLAFDAMVSDGYSDLKFRNNTDAPIYIKAYGDDKNAYVEIYGKPLKDGYEIKKRAEFVETLPHNGDIIQKDTAGEYSNKVTYQGEYYRLKKPQEGYHAKAYLQYWQNDALLEEKLIRDEIYKPQQGIIIEGTEPLGEGMELPENDVKIIPPQNGKINEVSAKRKIGMDNPSHLSP